jgi:hypothetical protein
MKSFVVLRAFVVHDLFLSTLPTYIPFIEFTTSSDFDITDCDL